MKTKTPQKLLRESSFHGQGVDRFAEYLAGTLTSRIMTMPGPMLERPSSFQHFQIGAAGLARTRGFAGMRFRYDSPERFVFSFVTRGQALMLDERGTTEVACGQAYLPGLDKAHEKAFAGDFEQVAFAVPHNFLRSKLEVLTGQRSSDPFYYKPEGLIRPDINAMVAQILLSTLAYLNEAGEQASEVFIRESKHFILLQLLFRLPHSLSHLLVANAATTGPRHLAIAEDYIREHYGEPITIEDLVRLTGVSARSLFRSFKQQRGYSPFALLKRVRLEHALDMLRRPLAGTSVTQVAFACGFGQIGHFAKDYKEAFGELPSDTLNRYFH